MMTPYQSQFDAIVEHLKNDLSALRTGRVSPSLVEQSPVDAYGGIMKLIELASISVSDARTLVIEAWDKSLMKDIERALQQNKFGFSVVNDGQVIRVSFPTLTEETRNEIIKVANTKHESSKVSLRQLRDKIREDIQAKEKGKEMGEDEKFRHLDALEKKVKEIQDKLKEAVEKKVEELQA